MDPTGALAVVLPDQLVEGSVVHQPAKPRTPLGGGGQMQVGRLPTQMLALRDTPDRSVEGRASIATADHDRFPCEGTEWFGRSLLIVGEWKGEDQALDYPSARIGGHEADGEDAIDH